MTAATGRTRPVMPSERVSVGWIVFGDFVAGVALATTGSADLSYPRPNPDRALGEDRGVDDLGLPLAVSLELLEVRERILGPAVDLDAVSDHAHPLSLFQT